jgi:osmotically-inducible protein OsmY
MKTKLYILPIAVFLAITGCSKHSGAPGASDTGTTDRNNTAVNTRDRDSAAKTPFDQKENKADVTTTADIRKRIVATDMSTDAKNVKIITENGRVTLRGPVKSAGEKSQIEKIAVEIAGDGNVDNQLEVAVSR